MQINTLILGAGAAGMFCAAHAGPGTLVVDHAKAAGDKIRISGGGRCNFTNMYARPGNFLSQNPHFCKSALARYSQWDFIDLITRHKIAYHEKTLGQLFCDDSAKAIVKMLLDEMTRAGANLWLQTKVGEISHDGSHFTVTLHRDGKARTVQARNLVLATGGKSIPKMGATGLAYDIAQQFGLAITDTRPGLVPFTFSDQPFKDLPGVATPVRVTAKNGQAFDEALLFTHRGLSGPAMLQISSYWSEGEPLSLNFDPETTLLAALRQQRSEAGRKALTNILAAHLPARLITYLAQTLDLTGNLADCSDVRLSAICDTIAAWPVKPTGTEGYRTAEVTLGGIDTDTLSSKTLEAKSVPGLYAIGEAVDVTGWLGGFNFQWAWSSGYAAGTAIAAKV